MIIYPLVQIIELVYGAFDLTFNIPGISIIGVSIAVTLLCLPLYIVAEHWQQVERDTEKKLQPGVDRIKASFKGDEQYMILSTYYRENHYHPIMALRSSFGLLIQIPFFIAAYKYLSELQVLKGVSFLFIRDLGAEDALFHIGSFPVNVLPIAMTIINIIAGAIYCKGFPLKDKLQLYGMALIFLVLLYTSPSGLVLYWTMNNIFSLIKNLFYKLKNPKKVLWYFCIVLGILLDAYFIIDGYSFTKAGFLIAITIIIPFLPIIVKATKKYNSNELSFIQSHGIERFFIFFFSALIICLLSGLTIPSNVIVASPQEFSFVDSYTTPLFFIQNTFYQAAGFFLFWPLCIYLLYGPKGQSNIAIVFLAFALCSVVNAFCFPGHYGLISPLLIYQTENAFHLSAKDIILNFAALLAVIALIVVIFHFKKEKSFIFVTALFCIGLLGLGTSNCVKINTEFTKLAKVYKNEQSDDVTPIFHLSKTGKNVFVIMLDRAIGGFVPEIFRENKELTSEYSGFTYYPNTVSYAFFTLLGAPPLYGGYEYTPEEINKRSNETLVSKNNEALSVLPRLFAQNGYDATMTDSPWANYSWIPDMTMFSAYPEKIRAFNTMKTYRSQWFTRNHQAIPAVQSTLDKRNFICYSIMKMMPFVFRDFLYDNGNWWALATTEGRNFSFIDSYSVLDFMPLLTDTTAGTNGTSKNTFTFMCNDTTHDAVLLQGPDYVPAEKITQRGTSPYSVEPHYDIDAAALKRLGTWFKWMKDNGVYDNTRIIIASDHGRNIKTDAFSKEKKLPFMRESCHPVLLVKDFNAAGPLFTDNTFMTNADVPSLAVKDIIANPINPFTGKDITKQVQKNLVTVATGGNWMPEEHKKNTFIIPETEQYTVHTNIFDEHNWSPKTTNLLKKIKAGANKKYETDK
jgi:YidC/Oxa1 family membrane protein insertase